jgi:hypothetical protein
VIVTEWPTGPTTRPQCVCGVPPGLGAWRSGGRCGALRTIREPAGVLGGRADSLRDRSRVLGDRLKVISDRPSVLGDPLGDFRRPARVLGRSPGVFGGSPGGFGRPVTSSHRASRSPRRLAFDSERAFRRAERTSEHSGSASRGAGRGSFDSGRASGLSGRTPEDTETTAHDSGSDVSKRRDARRGLRASVRGLDADVRGLRGVVPGLDAAIREESPGLRWTRDARASPTASVRANWERRSRCLASRALHHRRDGEAAGRRRSGMPSVKSDRAVRRLETRRPPSDAQFWRHWFQGSATSKPPLPAVMCPDVRRRRLSSSPSTP